MSYSPRQEKVITYNSDVRIAQSSASKGFKFSMRSVWLLRWNHTNLTTLHVKVTACSLNVRVSFWVLLKVFSNAVRKGWPTGVFSMGPNPFSSVCINCQTRIYIYFASTCGLFSQTCQKFCGEILPGDSRPPPLFPCSVVDTLVYRHLKLK